MSAPFTPGPWRWKAELGRHEMPMLLGSDGLPVCDFGNSTAYYPIEGTPPEESDARLIAAAPDLYEALDELMYGPCERLSDTHQKARTALAKARGETL